MATIVLTNITNPKEKVLIQDLYAKVPDVAPFTLTFSRPMGALSAMPSLQAALDAGQVTMAITPTAAELGSGLLSPPNVVGADDIQAVPAAQVGAPYQSFYVNCPVGGGGADDVTMFAVNTLPYKIRVLDAVCMISTAAAGSWTVRTAAAGAGTALATFSSASTGRVVSTAPTATTVVSPGATVGIFVRRTDSTTVGEVMLLVRRES
jgi:hypothetical protein